MSDGPSKADIQQVFKRLRSAAANKVSQPSQLLPSQYKIKDKLFKILPGMFRLR